MKRWLKYLLFNEDGFFGFGMGPTAGEQKQAGEISAVANFGTSQGEGDISQADNFWRSIMSGDPTKISSVLGPQTSAINKQGQEQLKTASEFGNRGGGTNAAAQMAGDQTRSHYDRLVSSLTGEAASSLENSGHSLLNTGLSAHEGAFSAENEIQKQKAAKLNDIFKSITSIATAFLNPTSAAKSLFASKAAATATDAGGAGYDPGGGLFNPGSFDPSQGGGIGAPGFNG